MKCYIQGQYSVKIGGDTKTSEFKRDLVIKDEKTVE